MAAAIILIPEMLSGPAGEEGDPKSAAAQSPARAETGIKTYTIDLNQPPGSPAASSPVDDRAPPPEETTPLPTETVPEESAPPVQAKPEALQPSASAAVASAEPPAAAPAVVEPPTPSPRPAVSEPPASQPSTPPARALASTSSVPTSGGWAVQLGSFSKQATAERLMSELRAEGHEAFVMPVKSGGATLYRVRIGPMQDRASAESTLRTVKKAAPGAAIVAHP